MAKSTEPNRRASLVPHWTGLLALIFATALLRGAEAPNGSSRTNRSVEYRNERVAEVPWSIHVVKFDRSRPDHALHSTLAKGSNIGLSTLSEQIKALPPSLGRPIAAINGDFWTERGTYQGDPSGLQIMRGELVSGPGDRVCFWLDAHGQPHVTNVLSLFKVVWPDGSATPIGLNERRSDGDAVLYTSAIGPSTRTGRGRDLILERDGENPWLPLRVGETLTARVREVRDGADAPVAADTLVLSLGPQLAERAIARGAIVKISTATVPDLKGVQTAIGGGPTLVRNRQAFDWKPPQPRHPRTAIGWNQTHFFFVQVDGRQRGLSAGMTFPELADYLLKLGCTEAMNLDGGGSSTIWVMGQVMNSPCYGHERDMANALVLVKKDKDEQD